jgi:superfamily II DNA or RNA helicase
MGDQVILRGTAEIPFLRLIEEVEKMLTAEEERGDTTPGKAKKFPIYKVIKGGDAVLVPKFLYLSQIRRSDDKIIIKERGLDNMGLEFKGKFWEEQEPGALELVKTLSKYHGALGKGRCGTGKTVIGAYLLSRVTSMKSAVLVDQTNLAQQWAQQIHDHLPGAKISFIMPLKDQRRLFDKLGVPRPNPMVKEDTRGNVIIAMAQSLMRRSKDALPIPVTFLIVDEAHQFSAQFFAASVYNFSFRYSCALTATDKRRDGLDWIFKAILGTKTVKLAGKRMNPTVVSFPVSLSQPIKLDDHKMVWCRHHNFTSTKYNCRLNCPTGDYVPRDRGFGCDSGRFMDKLHFTEMSLRLSRDRMYNHTLARAIVIARQTGHQIIVFSKYKEHLKTLRQIVITEGIEENETSLYFGGMDKDKCLKPRITFATLGVAKKGLDAPWKDVAVLAMPVTEVEQIAGRIERVMEGKPRPTILDAVVETVPIFNNQWKARMKFYRSAGYECKTGSLQEARLALREAHKNRWRG